MLHPNDLSGMTKGEVFDWIAFAFMVGLAAGSLLIGHAIEWAYREKESGKREEK